MEGIFNVINKKVKNKVNILLNTILPSKIPEFSINDVENPLFFIYLNKNEVAFISHLDNKQADEIVKVGIINDEFIFYPLREDSIFFNKGSEFKTFEFIEVILSNKLNLVAKKIYNDIVFLSDKIIEYKTLYISRLQNIEFYIDIVDDSKILAINDTLNNAFHTAIKAKLYDITHTNILDTPLNIFSDIFPNGIYNVADFMEQKSTLDANMLKSYYNQSNIANPDLLEHIQLNIEGKDFEFECHIKSLLLQYSVTKKMFAKAQVHIKHINALNLQPDVILYSNNDVKVTIKRNSITIYNQTKGDISLHHLESIFVVDDNNPFVTKIEHINLKIPLQDEVSILLKKDNYFGVIKNLDINAMQNSKIKHSIKLTYMLIDNANNTESKNLIGSSQYKLSSIFNGIN